MDKMENQIAENSEKRNGCYNFFDREFNKLQKRNKSNTFRGSAFFSTGGALRRLAGVAMLRIALAQGR